MGVGSDSNKNFFLLLFLHLTLFSIVRLHHPMHSAHLGPITTSHVGAMPWALKFFDPWQSDVRTAMDRIKE